MRLVSALAVKARGPVADHDDNANAHPAKKHGGQMSLTGRDPHRGLRFGMGLGVEGAEFEKM
jgi:hypothetical protein